MSGKREEAMVDFISALGAGSGIDIKGLAKSLTDATKQPEQTQIDNKKKAAEARVSSVGKISFSQRLLKCLKSLGRTRQISTNTIFQ